MYQAHNYELMAPDKRPQDMTMDGKGWTFETLEHGGEYPDMMPQAIRATDPRGTRLIARTPMGITRKKTVSGLPEKNR